MSSGLLGPNGQPISSKTFRNKKVPAPITGEKFGAWGGPNVSVMSLPGGGAIQFDLSQLTLQDFRQMKDHYQINSSLSVLTFLLHQLEWRIECDNKAQQEFYSENMEEIWTRLVRGMSQAFWAGYSPNVLQWDNDTSNRRIVLDKVKDLIPEDCEVNWKKVDGYSTNKINVYDGIKNWGNAKPIPVDNTFWYPLLMENGDYYGKKLMRPAFQSWFFSILVHLFANRYYERFGEPTPIGRAPYDEDINYKGEVIPGNQAMELILQSLRSRSTVVLPNERTPYGEETNPKFDYEIEYLESQMRGADFERYMTRLDEEMSLALFTPILLMRTADVGSYNLGDMQSVIYQWMLNAIGGDWKQYIDHYILIPMRNWNFGTSASAPKIRFRRMGAQNDSLVRDLTSAMVTKGMIKPDVTQLGEMAGLTLTEVQVLTGTDPAAGPATDPAAGDAKTTGNTLRDLGNKISDRIADQAQNAFKKSTLKTTKFNVGFNNRLETELWAMGYADAEEVTKSFYARIEACLGDMAEFGVNEYSSPEDFVRKFRAVLFSEIDSLSEA